MSRRHAICIAVSVMLLASLSASAAVAATDVRVKKISGSLPKPKAIAFASGSGLVIGKHFVLTNRHIAQDEKKKLFDGFRVYLGPDYKKPIAAKVVAICDNYDLSLLETADDLPAVGVSVLDGLPPLSEHVIAYGFPLGSRFGVGLTTTGGQISRHPVAAAKGDDEEDTAVKSALWHDAVLTHGNSGGPLFTSSKILVGVNFAYLNEDSKQALAIPTTIVADFLRKAGATSGVTFVKSVDGEPGAADPLAMTVFIESMVDSVVGRDSDIAGASSLGEQLVAKLKTRLPSVSAAELKKVEAGEIQRAFPPVKVASIEPGDIARVQGTMMIDVLDDKGMFTRVDGVLCFVLLPPGEADDVRTKLAKNPNPKAPLDQLYFIGPPVGLPISDGTTRYAMVFFPLKKFAESKEFKKIIAEEKERRGSQLTPAEAEQQEKAISRYLTTLRHTFSDTSGKFQVDAVPIKLNLSNVDLIRLSDKQQMSVPIEKLSSADRLWLRDNDKWVSLYGPKLKSFYLPASDTAENGQAAKVDH